MVRIDDPHHEHAYSIWETYETDISIFPTLAWFEFQATISRLRREGKRAQRDLYLLDGKNLILPIDQTFIERCAQEDLANRFNNLRGADLVYACAAALENAALVTFDTAFREINGRSVLPAPR